MAEQTIQMLGVWDDIGIIITSLYWHVKAVWYQKDFDVNKLSAHSVNGQYYQPRTRERIGVEGSVLINICILLHVFWFNQTYTPNICSYETYDVKVVWFHVIIIRKSYDRVYGKWK